MKIEPTQAAPRAQRATLSADFIAHQRRLQLASVVAELLCEKGFKGTTVHYIVARARIARNTFYEYFGSKAECIDWACAEGHRRLFGAAEESYAAAETWRARIDAALGTLLRAAAADPALSELCLIHSMALVDREVMDRDAGVKALSRLLDEGRGAGGRVDPPPMTAELIAGGLISVISTRLRRGEADRLPTLQAELVEFSVGRFLADAVPF